MVNRFMKTNIAFYLPNKGYNNVDIKGFVNSNPGIGGTEYAILLIVDYLVKKSTILNCYLFVDSYIEQLPEINDKIRQIEISSYSEGAKAAIANNVSYLVVPYGYFDEGDFWESIGGQFKVIMHCHCFLPLKKLNEYSKNPNIVRIITVGREQLDLYRDHSAFAKSDYIYNPIPEEQILTARANFNKNREPYSVTYMGSLTPAKSFDVLAKAWCQVIREVPGAKLNVIGGGNLYNRKRTLGKWGLAEEKYESSFMRYLLDEEGKIIPSVRFFGVLGNEKNDILNKTWVGVPNPTGATETFGLVAVEMQMGGCLIATQRCPGFIDTVVSKQSILYNDPEELAESIVKLFNINNTTHNDALSEIDKKFNINVIGEEWLKLFTDCIPYGRFLHDHNRNMHCLN